MAQTVKCLLAMLETRVRFLGREDPLEKEMAIHSSTLAWKIPWREESDRLHHGVAKSQTWLSDWTELNWTEFINLIRKVDPSLWKFSKESDRNSGDPRWVWSLGGEDALEKEMATHSSFLAWRSPWTEELGGLQSMGLQRVRHDCVNNISMRGVTQKVY